MADTVAMGRCLMVGKGGIWYKGRIMAVAFGLSLFIGLAMRGSPIDRGPTIRQADVAVKAMPSYAQDIQPILDGSCTRCHGPLGAAAGLDMSSYAGLGRGADSGPVVISGYPELSRLVAHLSKEPKCLLPGDAPTPNQAKNLERWIQAGARNN